MSVMQNLNATSAGAHKLANFEFLLNDDAYVAGIGLRISEKDRLLLLADLGCMLSWLHHMGIALGDLSP